MFTGINCLMATATLFLGLGSNTVFIQLLEAPTSTMKITCGDLEVILILQKIQYGFSDKIQRPGVDFMLARHAPILDSRKLVRQILTAVDGVMVEKETVTNHMVS